MLAGYIMEMEIPGVEVFCSYNSLDRPAVEVLARRLHELAHIRPWLDNWNLIPGQSWQIAIESALRKCTSCAVFIGPEGVSPWQTEEVRAAIDRRVRDITAGFRVVPVFLPGGKKPGHAAPLPTFLASATYVEFQNLDDEIAFHRLVSGIRGVEPGPLRGSNKEGRVRFALVLTGTVDELNKPLVEAIAGHLRKLTGDATLTMEKIEAGSIVLSFECSGAAYAWIEFLFATGQFKEIEHLNVETVVPLRKSTRRFYEKDGSLAPLNAKTIGIIGYGSQGHAHALNLRDSGLNVVVGLPAGSKSKAKAMAAGLPVLSISAAAEAADLIMILTPDHVQGDNYRNEIAPYVTKGKTLMFAHGFSLHFNEIPAARQCRYFDGFSESSRTSRTRAVC